jgi:hypothetical protein
MLPIPQGKTSLILSFLERKENPERTLALDFNFARRTTNNMVGNLGFAIIDIG